MTDHDSFVACRKWLENYDKFAPEPISILAAGINYEDVEHRSVTEEEIDVMCTLRSIPFRLISTKTGQGIDDLFLTAVEMALRRMHPESFPSQKAVDRKKDDKCIIC